VQQNRDTGKLYPKRWNKNITRQKEATVLTVHEKARDVPVIAEVDVAVVGGGPAGFIAAVSAARTGARVVLVERYGHLGGLATGGLVLYIGGLFGKDGRRVIGGFAWEMLERLKRKGGLAEDSPQNLHVDSELLKVEAEQMCLEASCTLRLHSWAVGSVVDSQRVSGILLESKSGRQALLAKVCVDATGDGDIAAFSNADHELHQQKIGLNLKIGCVNRERYRQFERNQPDRFRELRTQLLEIGGVPLQPNTTPQCEAGIFWVNVLGLSERSQLGTLEGPIHERFKGTLSCLNVEDLTHVEVELKRRIMLSLDHYRKNVPGFEDVQLLGFASQLGVRESRLICGLYRVSRMDVIEERQLEGTIGICGYQADEIQGSFPIPYGCLVPRKVDGLLVAGRCISTDHWTQQFARLIAPSMMTGQAAGKAAALCIKTGVEPRDLDPELLRFDLAQDGVILET
jgi:ribulose 1,5-bisphosphate synthetase/thiazole synthase